MIWTGSIPSATSEATNIRTPSVPTIPPGMKNSATMNARPSQKKTKARFGSRSEWKKPAKKPIVSSVTVAPATSSVTGSPETWTVMPSTSARSVGTSGAIRSITPSCSASSAEALSASRTADSAQTAFRSRVSAMLTMYSAASFTAFSEATAPDSPTGCAAPTLVAGAIAATFVDSRMNVPAEAARAPDGETYPITGTFAFKIACVICRIDESSPPGVSSVSSTAAAPASAASAMPPSTWSATKGSTTPSIRSSTTCGEPDCASAPWAPSDTHAAARQASTAARRRIIRSPPPSSHRRERRARYPARRQGALGERAMT